MTYAQTRKQDRSTINTNRWKAVRLDTAKRAHFRCEICSKYVGLLGQAEHIVPRSICKTQGIDPFDMA